MRRLRSAGNRQLCVLCLFGVAIVTPISSFIELFRWWSTGPQVARHFAKDGLEKIHRCLYSTRTGMRIKSIYLQGDRTIVTGEP